MKEAKSWGVVWHPGIKHSNDGDCPYPDCDWKTPGREEMNKYLVGFSTELKGGMNAPGGRIFECPKCFEKFWYHTYTVPAPPSQNA